MLAAFQSLERFNFLRKLHAYDVSFDLFDFTYCLLGSHLIFIHITDIYV